MRRLSLIVVAAVLVSCTAGEVGREGPAGPSSPARPPSVAAVASASSAATTEPSETAPSNRPEATPSAWSSIDVPDATGPSPREDHTWTVDAAGEVAYLFGGRDGATLHGDLWAFDLTEDAWTSLETPNGPPARFGHEAVWMDGIGLVIVFGQAGTTFFNDLWAYDPTANAWRQLASTGDVPKERYGSCASVGPDGRLWISHGFTSDGTRFADTLAYDVGAGTWTDVTPDGTVPVNRCLHGCWWTDDGALALYGGQTTGTTALGDRWALTDGSWERLERGAMPDRNLYARARVPGATVVVGGQGLDGGFLADTWVIPDGGGAPREWLAEGEAPTGRAGAELVHDPARGRLLLFGGRAAGGSFADLWQLAGVPTR